MANDQPEWLTERIQRNIRLLKSLRDLSDERLAERGGFTSRQVLSNRISGRSSLTTDDLARIAAGCDVEPYVLLLPANEVLEWVENHLEFRGRVYIAAEPNPNKARASLDGQ